MKAPHEPLAPPRSILVLKPSSFGDVIHTLPAVAELKSRFPDSHISWLINPEWASLLAKNASVAEIVPFPRKEFRGWSGISRFARWLRNQIVWRRPDLTLDFQGLLRTAFIGRCAGSARFVGLPDAREGASLFYDETASMPPGVPHAVERYLALSDAITTNSSSSTKDRAASSVEFPLPEGVPLGSADDYEKRFVLLHPFSRGKGKSLTAEQVIAFCGEFAPIQVVVVGGAPVIPLVLPANGLNLLNQTSLLQLIWLLRRSSFVVSVDSGPAHLAAALKKPMVAIHTWSDPRRVGPYFPAAWVFKSGELLQFRELSTRPEDFFSQSSDKALSHTQMEMICRLATSS